MIERPRRVVLLIDYDNLQICAARDTPGRDLQLPPVVQLAQRYGTVILARAYAEWNLSTERLAVYKAGIEPAFAPVLRTESDRSGKSLADTVMVAEGMDMLWTLSPDVVVLATSDKDLIPLVRVAKQRGAFVVVLGSDFTAIPLREMADEHVTYRQLITDASGRFTVEPASSSSRSPAPLTSDSPRRRSRERTGPIGRERTPTVSTPPASPALPPARVEREPAPLAAPPVPQPVVASSASTTEAVAPLSTGSSTDADGPGGVRRRRRRGSRRRSERLGLTSDGQPSFEGGSESDSDFLSESELAAEAEAEYAADAEYAAEAELANGAEAGFDEPSELDAVEEALDDLLFPATTEPSDLEVAEASSGTVEVPPALIADEDLSPLLGLIEAPVVAPPRDRRRRTRRPAAGSDVLPTLALDSTPTSSAPVEEATPTSSLPLPVSESGSVDEPPANGVLDAEDAAPAPRTRSRRVSSSSRGRTRSSSR